MGTTGQKVGSSLQCRINHQHCGRKHHTGIWRSHGHRSPGICQTMLQYCGQEFSDLLFIHPGVTNAATHHINAVGPPACDPPMRIPVHVQEEVEHQIRNMLHKGIIEDSIKPRNGPLQFTCERRQVKSGHVSTIAN